MKYSIKDKGRQSSPQLREAARDRLRETSQAYMAAKVKRDEIRARLLTAPEYVEAVKACRDAEVEHGRVLSDSFYYRFEAVRPYALGSLIAGEGDSRIEAIEDAKTKEA